MTNISFVAASLTLDLIKAVGIPTAPHTNPLDACPFIVGDFISYPQSAPGISFRVAWRLYGHGGDGKAPHWVVGLEQASHPLEDLR